MPGRAGDFGQPIPGYEVLELLGSGGMSSVYKARQRGLDRYVAIKVIRIDHLDPRLALARLTKEAQVLARLDHPGIVRSIDFGETGELVWFVMELVEGRSCKELLNERGPLPLREVLTIGESVTTALDHAARHGVVHRDVKPGNILLARDGAVKLTDFGLARATSDRSLTKIGITVGTPQYMSPEQVKSPRRVDLRSDFYSLGATLYHLATGRPPFGGETVGETLHEVLYGRPTPIEQVDPTVPPAFSRLLARLLARDPARRYASGAELLADLARVRASLDGAAAGEVGLSWQDAGEPPPFRWLPWTLVAAGVVVAVAAGASLLNGGRGAEPRDAAAAERRLLDEYRDALASEARPAVAIAADLARLKEEGTFTAESAAARVDLTARALDRFSGDVERARREATAAALAVLAHGDFAGARRAFDDALGAARDRLVPAALRASLPQVLRDFDEVLRRAAATGLAPLDKAADAVARKVRGAVRETRNATKSRLDEALEKLDFAAAAEAIRRHPAVERDACVAATREALAASGVAVDPAATAEALARGWPEAVAAEVTREPVESDVDRWNLDLANALDHCRGDALARIAEARSNDLADLGDAARGANDPPGDDVAEAARRKSELQAQLAPRRAALLASGRAAPAVAAIDAALDAHGQELDEVVAKRRARRAEEARVLLLEGDGEQAGLDELLADRRVADARARIAASVALSDDDRERWSGVVESQEKLLAAAGAALQAKVGTTVELRDRRGLPYGGKLVDEGNGQFRVEKLRGLKVADLRVDSLLSLLPAGAVAERDRLIASWYFGDPKSRGGLDEALASAGDDPVVAHLRALRDDERAGAAAMQDKREASADAAWKEFQDALGKGDPARAQAAWSQLDRLRGTKAAKAAFSEREKNERALETVRGRARREARLLAIAPHASERVDDPEAGVAIGYDFSDVDQGAEWGLAGNDVRIENGRLHFAGGAAGRRARLYGPALRLPLDRKAPARLELDLTPSTESPEEPRFIGIRLGALCVVFARPEAAVREESKPQLALWFGSLDEQGDDHIYLPELGSTQPTQGRSFEVGLERGVRSQLEIRWLPRADGAAGEVEVWLNREKVATAQGTMNAPATPPEKDVLELRSATALDVESLRFTGRIRG